MYIQTLYPILSRKASEVIEDATIKQLETGIPSAFSFQTIKAEGRKPALAMRMTSKPIEWEQAEIEGNKLKGTGKKKSYSGKEIADIYIKSVKKNGYTFFPVTGTLPSKKGIEQIILFVKELVNEQKYLPYARFEVIDFINSNKMTKSEYSTLTDVTPLFGENTKYSILLKIESVVVTGLAENYLGNASAEGIYEKAFKGASPIIICI